jgi:hypothetical protein
MSDSWRDRLRPVGDVQPVRDLLPGIFERVAAPAVGRDRGRRFRRPAGFVLAGMGCVLVLGALAFAAHSRGMPDAGQSPPSSRTALFTTHRANGYRLQFRYPASWHAYHWTVVGAFTFSMAYLSTAVEHDPCVSTAYIDTCGSPITTLEPNGVLVSWTAESFLGERDFSEAAGRIRRLPSGWFVKLSTHTHGSEGSSDARRTIVAVTAPTQHSKKFWTLRARLRGPKLASNTQAVLALLDSTKQIRDPADESPSTTFTITYRHDQLRQTGPMVKVSDPPLHLSCNPAVGDVTNPAEACRLIQAHPARYIGRAGHVCRGPVTRWDVKIHGLFRGRPVSRDYDMCDYPQARAWTDLGGTTLIGVVPAGSPEAIAGPKNR